MSSLIGFMIEKSVVNSFPIFMASLLFAFIAGPFLKGSGVNKYLRIGVYSLIGVFAGLWTYSAYDIPERAIEVLEALTLGVAMLIYALVVIAPVVLFKNRQKT